MDSINYRKKITDFVIGELNALLASFVFFTAIPLPSFAIMRGDYRNSLRYFPLVGWFTGAVSAIIFLSVEMAGFDRAIAIILSMIVSTWITGALHEDGLADTFDGLGGGRERENILRIMKDSSSGSYGVLALIFTKALYFALLMEISDNIIPMIIIAAESFSRMLVFASVILLPYARNDSSSRAGGVTRDYRVNIFSIIVPLLLGFTPAIFFFSQQTIEIFLPSLIAAILITMYYKKRLYGYTGDMLGAIQQLTLLIIMGSFSLMTHMGLLP